MKDDRGDLDLTKQIEIKDKEIETLNSVVLNLKNIIDMKDAEITARESVSESHKKLNGELRKELDQLKLSNIKNVEDAKKEADKLMIEKIKKYEKQIEELMKSKLISAEGQVRSNERKILEEIEARAIDLGIEKVRAKLSKSLSGNDYDKLFDASIQSIEKGLMRVYS